MADQRGGPTEVTRARALEEVLEVTTSLAGAMRTVIEGKPEVVQTAITALLAEGHLLLEDAGVGKTMLAKTLAKSIDCTVRRIQFTPDPLPSDITGVSMFNQDVRSFEFRPGAIFANVVVGDEINRASPKTQSALPNAWREGTSRWTGGPIPSRIPSSSWRRRTPSRWRAPIPSPRPSATASWRGSPGYPNPRSEIDMPAGTAPAHPERLQPVTDAATVSRLIHAVRLVHSSDSIRQYIVDLATATRESSPRDWAYPRAPRCTCCAPAAPTRLSPGATMCCPTTSRRWSSRYGATDPADRRDPVHARRSRPMSRARSPTGCAFRHRDS